MPTFLHGWSPYGPSGRLEAEHLDAACTVIHLCLEAMDLQVTARHLPPEDGIDPMMPREGCVLVVRSQEPRYGDNAQLRVAVYELGQTSYHDQCRRKLEAQVSDNGKL